MTPAVKKINKIINRIRLTTYAQINGIDGPTVLSVSLAMGFSIDLIASLSVTEAIGSMVLVTWRVSLSTEMLE